MIDYYGLFLISMDVAAAASVCFFLSRFFDRKPKGLCYLLFIAAHLAVGYVVMAAGLSSLAGYLMYIAAYTAVGAALFCVLPGESLAAASVAVAVCSSVENVAASITLMLSGLAMEHKPVVLLGLNGPFIALLSWLCLCVICVRLRPAGRALAIVPPMLLIVLMGRLAIGEGVAVDGQLQIKSLFSPWQTLTLFLLALLCIFVLLYFYRRLTALEGRELENALIEERFKLCARDNELSRSRYEMARSLRHDLNNHYAVIKGLLGRGEYASASIYLDSLNSAADSLTYPANTGNPALNVCLSDKLSLARHAGIEVECDAASPPPGAIDDMDLCALFANALDNALSACEGCISPYIRINARIRRSFYVIDIANSASGIKKRGSRLGVPNMERIAQKYGGTLDARREEGRFTLRVLLPFAT